MTADLKKNANILISLPYLTSIFRLSLHFALFSLSLSVFGHILTEGGGVRM